MKFSDFMSIESRTASTSAKNCLFCLHVWQWAIYFFFKWGRESHRLELFTPSTSEGHLFNHIFRYSGRRKITSH